MFYVEKSNGEGIPRVWFGISTAVAESLSVEKDVWEWEGFLKDTESLLQFSSTESLLLFSSTESLLQFSSFLGVGVGVEKSILH